MVLLAITRSAPSSRPVRAQGTGSERAPEPVLQSCRLTLARSNSSRPTKAVQPLVGLGAEIFGSFELHGFVEEDFDGVGHPFKAVVGQ